jgi:hypothetical protein
MKISQDQADALGGCQECQPGGAPMTKGSSAALASVVSNDPSKPTWIAIELRTPDGAPVPGEPFVIELPDGKAITGKLDNLGKIRVEGVDPGNCKVSFPERDAKEWKKA